MHQKDELKVLARLHGDDAVLGGLSGALIDYIPRGIILLTINI